MASASPSTSLSILSTQPNDNATPPYFQPVLDLPAVPVPGLAGTVVANMSRLAANAATMQAPQAAQYMTATVTFEPTDAMIKEAYAAFSKSLPQIDPERNGDFVDTKSRAFTTADL